MIVKNIYLSRAVDRGAVPTDKQRIMEEYRAIFGRMTMSVERYAMCARVCGQCPDEDICGPMSMPYDQESESLTLKLLGNVIEVYTVLLIQDMKAEMKSNIKAAEIQTNRQIMREQRMQKVAAEKVAKEETEAVVRAEAEAEEKRVAAQKKAAREAEAAEQQRRSREGDGSAMLESCQLRRQPQTPRRRWHSENRRPRRRRMPRRRRRRASTGSAGEGGGGCPQEAEEERERQRH